MNSAKRYTGLLKVTAPQVGRCLVTDRAASFGGAKGDIRTPVYHVHAITVLCVQLLSLPRLPSCRQLAPRFTTFRMA